MSRDVRVLLVGAGRAGLVHGRNFAQGIRGARLVGVADPDLAAVDRAGAELGCEQTLTDPLAAVTRDDVDAVVVACPTFAHAEVVTAALGAGKHVLCEKPLAATQDQAACIAHAAAASSAGFVMGFMRRFDAGFRRVAQHIADGAIGEPLFVRSTGRGPGLPPEWAWDPERSGGLLAEVNSHDLDTVRWLTAQEAQRIHAIGRAAKRPDIAERYPGFVDLVAATIELSGGALAQVDGACPAGYGYDARAEVYGSEGALVVGSPRAGSVALIRADGLIADPVSSWRALFADAYRAEDGHLVAVARGDEAPCVTVDDGRKALAMVVAANASMRSGAPVAVEPAG